MSDETMDYAESDVEVQDAPIETGDDNLDPTDLSDDESYAEDDDFSDDDAGVDGDEGDDGEDSDPDEESGLELTEVEVVIDGEKKKYSVPKEIGDTFTNMNRDYTTKTQALAEKAKALEARDQQVITYAETLRKESEAIANIKGLHQQLTSDQQRLQELSQTDWDALEQEDFIAANQKWREFTALQTAVHEKRAAIQAQKANLDQTIQQRTADADNDFRARAQQAWSYAEQNIKGWSSERDAELLTFLRDRGISDAAIKANMNVQFLELVDLAEKGHRLQNTGTKQKQQGSRKTRPAVKQEDPSVEALKPTAKVGAKGGKTTNRKDPNKMTPGEDRKWREKR